MNKKPDQKRRPGHALLNLMALFIIISSASAVEIDNETGLVIAPGFETVKLNCTVCHSAKIITQNRMDRKGWLKTIMWMQETQGLWAFEADVEKEILDYLSTQYRPERIYRRPPLSVEWDENP